MSYESLVLAIFDYLNSHAPLVLFRYFVSGEEILVKNLILDRHRYNACW